MDGPSFHLLTLALCRASQQIRRASGTDKEEMSVVMRDASSGSDNGEEEDEEDNEMMNQTDTSDDNAEFEYLSEEDEHEHNNEGRGASTTAGGGFASTSARDLAEAQHGGHALSPSFTIITKEEIARHQVGLEVHKDCSTPSSSASGSSA